MPRRASLEYGEILTHAVTGKQGEVGMRLIETLKGRTQALKVREVADLLGVTPQHIYKLAAGGRIPSFRVSGAVRFDPGDVATWLKEKQAQSTTRITSSKFAA